MPLTTANHSALQAHTTKAAQLQPSHLKQCEQPQAAAARDAVQHVTVQVPHTIKHIGHCLTWWSHTMAMIVCALSLC